MKNTNRQSGAARTIETSHLSDHTSRVVHFLAKEAGLCVDRITVAEGCPVVHVSYSGRMSSVRIPRGTDHYVRATLRGEFVRVAQALNGRATYYCPTCGSTDITFDGQVRWDRESGAWTLLEFLNHPWCGGCSDTIHNAIFGEVGHE
ncbi:MAG: hypothetical protein EOO16_03245 [Chitinophagaceae bacterium]|nr:MAG: hypothetical protein EOO16_03245 [Chitinophagaceae bacterium]